MILAKQKYLLFKSEVILAIVSDLCKALVNNEFVYYYQPIYSLTNGKLFGAEALIRWIKEDGEILLPASFIPIAEEKGLIEDITLEMLPKLIRDIKEIINFTEDNFYTAFNLSKDMLTNNTISKHLDEELSIAGLSSSKIGVEISENTFMPFSDSVQNTIHQIAELGVNISLDDFSAGYTTLENLNQLPLSNLKLSMKIIRAAPTSRNDFRLLRHLISMAHQLRLSTIAEGVETHEEYFLLTSTGCTATQGFYFSHPLPFNNFIELVHSQSKYLGFPFGLEYLAQIDHIDYRRDIIREALTIFNNKNTKIRKHAYNRIPNLSSSACLLSDWINHVSWQWYDKADITELKKLHEDFHEAAHNLLDISSADTTEAQINQSITTLVEISINLMDKLQRISTNSIIHSFNRVGKPD